MENSRISKIFDKLFSFCAVLAGILLFALMLIVGLEVALRYFFGRPTSWVVEVSEYILLFIPFLVAAWVLKNEGHVKMDLLMVYLSNKTRHLVNAITSFICILICLILTIFGLKTAVYYYSVGFRTPTELRMPKYLLISIIWFGTALLLIQFIRRLYAYLRAWKNESEA